MELEIGKNLEKFLENNGFNSLNEKWEDLISLIEGFFKNDIEKISVEILKLEGGDSINIWINKKKYIGTKSYD